MECLLANFNFIISERATLDLPPISEEKLIAQFKARLGTSIYDQDHLTNKFFNELESKLNSISPPLFNTIFIIVKELQIKLYYKHIFKNNECQ